MNKSDVKWRKQLVNDISFAENNLDEILERSSYERSLMLINAAKDHLEYTKTELKSWDDSH